MKDWSKKITNKEKVDDEIDYIMCIDENGNSYEIKHILKLIANGKKINPDERYFTITGCIFTKKNYNEAKKKINNLKNKYWKKGKFLNPKTNIKKAVCFHSREIRRHEGCFNESEIDYKNFINDLSTVLERVDCKIISISIDLQEYVKRCYTHDIYNVAFDFLLERYIISTIRSKTQYLWEG